MANAIEKNLARSKSDRQHFLSHMDTSSLRDKYDDLASIFNTIREIEPLCDKLESPADKEECLTKLRQEKQANKDIAIDMLKKYPPSEWRKRSIDTFTIREGWQGFLIPKDMPIMRDNLRKVGQMCRDIGDAECAHEVDVVRTNLDRAYADREETLLRSRWEDSRSNLDYKKCWTYSYIVNNGIHDMVVQVLDNEKKMEEICGIYPTEPERAECMDRLEADRRIDVNTAQDFIQRCPPDEILKEAMDEYRGSKYIPTTTIKETLDGFESICKKADDKVCATVVDNIRQRIYKELSLAD